MSGKSPGRKGASATLNTTRRGLLTALLTAPFVGLNIQKSLASSGQKDTLARLKASLAQSATSNVETSGIYSPAPVVSKSPHGNESLTNHLAFYDGSDKILLTGGRLYSSVSAKTAVVATQDRYPELGNLRSLLPNDVNPPFRNQGEQCVSCYTIWFSTNSRYVELSAETVNPLRVIVDGHYIDPMGWILKQDELLSIDFGSEKPRMIGLDANYLAKLHTVKISRSAQFTRPEPLNDTVAIFTGDSHLQGGVAGPANLAGHLVGKLCGFFDCGTAAIGRTGYLANGGGALSKIFDQMDYWIEDKSYDLIGFAAGFNDSSYPIDAVASEARRCWAKAREKQPNSFIVVFGPWSTNRGPDKHTTELERKLSEAFSAWRDDFSAFIPVSTGPEGSWETGTGNDIARNGTGNSDIYTNGKDLPHYNMIGQVYRGHRMAKAIREAISKF